MRFRNSTLSLSCFGATVAMLLALISVVSVAVAQSSPSIDFNSPAAGATFASPASISLRVSVTDPENRIKKIEYWANQSRGGGIHYPGAFINSATLSPYAVTWPNVTGGTHTITAIGKDASGNFVLSVPTTVVVTGNPNIRPTVRIREPVQDSVLVANTPVVFKVDASDGDGSVSCVRFSSLGLLGYDYIGQDCSAPYTFSWNPGNGNYEVQALAIDNVGQSNGTSVEFAIGNRRPTVSITSPAYGSTVAPNQQFTVAASATDTDGAVVKVEFWDQVGGTRYGVDTTAPYTQALVAPQNGSINVVAIAHDDDGAIGQSSRMRLEVASYAPVHIDVASPLAGASFMAPATVPITAAVSDPQLRVTSVDFVAQTADATIVLGADTSPPYTFNWTNVPAGSFHISARAYTPESGALPGALSLQVPINVFAANAPPTVSLTAPADLSTYTGPASIEVAANASDSDGSIARVEFYRDGNILATADAPPYEIKWVGVEARKDSYVIYAKAYDQQGAYTISASRSIAVNPAPRPPEVALVSPSDGQAFLFPASIQLVAAAADADGPINKVEFYANQQLVFSDVTPPYAFTWMPSAVGTYSLSAKAIDDDGLFSVSDPVVVSTAAAPAEVLHFYHSDAQGSIVAVSDAAGQRVTSTSYRPFGQIAAGTGESSPTRLGFTGKLRDTDLELSYFGARFYDSVYGRFIALDPVDFHPGDLQTFGRYGYAKNNPYRFVDPDGRQSRDVEWEFRISGGDRSRQDGINLPAWMLVEAFCGFCDLNYQAPPGSGQVQPVAAPWEVFMPSRAMAGSWLARETAALVANNLSRVGRWMSRAEYQAMKTTRMVQVDSAGMHRVAYPASPEAYKGAPKGDIYVEYDVPTSSLSPGGAEAWRTIHGPGSPAARLAEKKGLPIPELPTFENLSEPLLVK